MNDDFDFNEMMGDGKEIEKKLESFRQKMIEEAIHENFKRISENGLNEYHMRHLDRTELVSLKQTLDTMLAYFVDPEREEYEKCTIISEQLNKINSILHFSTTRT